MSYDDSHVVTTPTTPVTPPTSGGAAAGIAGKSAGQAISDWWNGLKPSRTWDQWGEELVANIKADPAAKGAIVDVQKWVGRGVLDAGIEKVEQSSWTPWVIGGGVLALIGLGAFIYHKY